MINPFLLCGPKRVELEELNSRSTFRNLGQIRSLVFRGSSLESLNFRLKCRQRINRLTRHWIRTHGHTNASTNSASSLSCPIFSLSVWDSSNVYDSRLYVLFVYRLSTAHHLATSSLIVDHHQRHVTINTQWCNLKVISASLTCAAARARPSWCSSLRFTATCLPLVP
jgi:hypothetical protein